MTTQITINVPEGYYVSNVSFAPIVANEIQRPVNVIEQEEVVAPPQPVVEPAEVAAPPPQPVVSRADRVSAGIQRLICESLSLLVRSEPRRNADISQEHKRILLELYTTNSARFHRVVHLLRLPLNEKRNLLASIWRMKNPERVREYGRRSYLRRRNMEQNM